MSSMTPRQHPIAFFLYSLLVINILLLVTPDSSVRCGSKDKYDLHTGTVIQVYEQAPCLTEEEFVYGREIIKGLGYNSARIFKRFCQLPDGSFAHFQRCWQTLLAMRPTFEHVECFESWTKNFDVSASLALNGLLSISRLNFQAGKSFRLFCKLPDISPEFSLSIIPLLLKTEARNHRALHSYLSIKDMTPSAALQGINKLFLLHGHQAEALETLSAIKDMNRESAFQSLLFIQKLNQHDAWNSATFFRSDTMTPDKALHYLTSYFALSPKLKEQVFADFPAEKKNLLLTAFYQGGEELIWKVNNLHAITDNFGYEISQRQLRGYSIEALIGRFQLLSAPTRRQFKKQFNTATANRNKGNAIATLKQATGAERRNVAKTLSSANIYCLMARGSELYDSSFRNILTPILHKRIKGSFNNNLLTFLARIDPDGRYISDFIISLAQKGKLTALLPRDSGIQQQILALTIDSAFHSEDSIILFSATFMRLLEVLNPDSRSFLIQRIIAKAAVIKEPSLKLIIALLQYYQSEYQELLGPENKKTITDFLALHHTINLDSYRLTPFQQWKSDNKLASLSVFHPDDDGRRSFQTNGATLIAGGYRPKLSTDFTLSPLAASSGPEIKKIIRAAGSGSPGKLIGLFDTMHRYNFAVDFTKSLNNVTINHSVIIYQSPQQQQLLLKRFLQRDIEMFAQRGHSYWRSEQLIDPFQQLLDSKDITAPLLLKRQRFLSLGSCGGVKAYSKLNRLFLGNVDILATIGTGLATINDPYNKNLFEIIAQNPSTITWKEVTKLSSHIFSEGRGRDYLQPGSLPAILHRLLEEEKHETTR